MRKADMKAPLSFVNKSANRKVSISLYWFQSTFDSVGCQMCHGASISLHVALYEMRFKWLSAAMLKVCFTFFFHDLNFRFLR